MDIRMDGKRVLVTGGNTGIGRAISETLGAAGARVAINYLDDPDTAEEVAGVVDRGGGKGLSVQGNVARDEDVEAMFARLDRDWGGIDVLVNNAGIDGPRAKAWEVDPSAWRKVIEVNLLGAFACSREALKRMVPAKAGVILNITSVHELIPWSGYSAYAAAKAAVGMLTKTLAQEAAPFGVRVVALGPGAVKTHINRDVWSDPEKRRDLLTKIPLNRLGEPQDIANMALMLVSDAASYVTGSTVFVDGAMIDYPDFAHGG